MELPRGRRARRETGGEKLDEPPWRSRVGKDAAGMWHVRAKRVVAWVRGRARSPSVEPRGTDGRWCTAGRRAPASEKTPRDVFAWKEASQI